MKILLRTLLGILIVLVLAIAGLFLYLNDARLRALILPEVQQALGREVQIDRVSFVLFRTFPNAGVVIEGFLIPDPEHVLLFFDELINGIVANPSVSLNRNVVLELVTEYLRSRGTDQVEDAARRLLRGLRGN